MFIERHFETIVHLLSKLEKQATENTEKLDKLMSQITDWAATEQADLTAISTTLDGIVTGIAALDAKITALQESPTLSASDAQALADIKTASFALVTKVQAISTAPPA